MKRGRKAIALLPQPTAKIPSLHHNVLAQTGTSASRAGGVSPGEWRTGPKARPIGLATSLRGRGRARSAGCTGGCCRVGRMRIPRNHLRARESGIRRRPDRRSIGCEPGRIATRSRSAGRQPLKLIHARTGVRSGRAWRFAGALPLRESCPCCDDERDYEGRGEMPDHDGVPCSSRRPKRHQQYVRNGDQ